MRIPADIPSLWYQNDKGDKWFPRTAGECHDPPTGFIYLHVRSVGEMHHDVYRAVVQEEVEACQHPAGYVIPTYGWVDGVVGRECRLCHGTQVRRVGEPWPKRWEANGARKFASGGSTPNDLVTAMVRSSQFDVCRATLICSLACERCLNVLYREYLGDERGYPEGSAEWNACGTRCEFCAGVEVAVDGVVDEMIIDSISSQFADSGVSFWELMRFVLRQLGWEFDPIRSTWESPEKRRIGGVERPAHTIPEGIISNHCKDLEGFGDFLRRNKLGRVEAILMGSWDRIQNARACNSGE